MSTIEETSAYAATPSRKPGLLVEDRNAAVRTNREGEQTIVKVLSRPVEAERQGVDEARI